jgi:4'-phosphopantetheinyl transferase
VDWVVSSSQAKCRELKAGEVHCWQASLAGYAPLQLDEFAASLSPAEAQRASQFATQRLARRYIAARGVVRRLCADYLQIEPAEVDLRLTPTGKPYIDGAALSLSISHCNDDLLLVLSRAGEVGCDIECTERRSMDFLSIAERYYSPAEYQDLLQLGPGEQEKRFLALWVCKEALLKLDGRGIAAGLTGFTVEIRSNNQAVVCDIQDDSLTMLSVADLRVRLARFSDRDYWLALATERTMSSISAWRWSS